MADGAAIMTVQKMHASDGPSAIACARVGDLDEAEQHLRAAEMSSMAWEGTAWQGAVAEAKGHLARAKDDHDEAANMFRAAADLFARAGQPLDERRCLAELPTFT